MNCTPYCGPRKEDSEVCKNCEPYKTGVIGTKYMNFVLAGDTGKTQIWEIQSKSSGAILGRIKWYGPWRQYSFFPSPECIFNRACIEDISRHLGHLNSQQREKKKEG